MVMVQGILERAAEWGRIPNNPARHVKKPRQGRTRAIDVLAPTDVEKLRRYLLDRDQLRDAVLVSVLAYAGLRPQEALALRWADVKERTLVVDKALSLGQERPTKTRAVRTVRLLPPLASDLKAWRLASGRPSDDGLVFPTAAGKPWTEFDYRNWRRRRYQRAVAATGLRSTRPYDLRHSFASLLFAERLNAAEVAGQLGHSTQVLLNTYLHVIEELRGVGKISAEKQIRAARRAAAKNGVARKLPKQLASNSGTR
jgi:integrase